MQIPRFKTLPALRYMIGGALVALMMAHSALALQPAAEVKRLRGELEALRLRYTDRHPDVVRILREIERLEAERSDTAQEPDARAANPAPATYFKFQKTGTLVKRPQDMPKPGPYWPTLVSMEAVKDFPFDYALYFSTDHHRGKGGILQCCSDFRGHLFSY